MFVFNEETGDFEGEAGGSDDGIVVSSGAGDTGTGNDVWSTILKNTQDIIRVASPAVVAAANAVRRSGGTQTAAAPQGSPAPRSFNPFPGLFSGFPQADGKGGTGVAAQGINPALLIIAAVIVVIMFIVSRR